MENLIAANIYDFTVNAHGLLVGTCSKLERGLLKKLRWDFTIAIQGQCLMNLYSNSWGEGRVTGPFCEKGSF